LDIDNGRASVPADAPIARAAASFLGQVLGLGEAPTDLASDLSAIKRDANAAIFTVQLESSVGPAAFLVYAYALALRGGDGRTGKEVFDAGLETLQQAAANDSPGPRAVAHAETDEYGFILATTPGTYRALIGESAGTSGLEAKPSDLPPTRELERIRSESAEELQKLLRQANQHAADWLSAIQGSGQTFGEGPDEDDEQGFIEFTERETELALFLLDEESIGSLLKALNVMVATAQEQAAAALENGDNVP
jgi:hypothetical protein